MHELSLALEICRIAESRVGNAAPSVVTVAVEVGDGAGVEPASLEFCLEALLAQPPFGRAHPRIVRTAGDAFTLQYLEIDDGRPDD